MLLVLGMIGATCAIVHVSTLPPTADEPAQVRGIGARPPPRRGAARGVATFTRSSSWPVKLPGARQGWLIQASAAVRSSRRNRRVGTWSSSVVHSETFASQSTSVTTASRSSFLM